MISCFGQNHAKDSAVPDACLVTQRASVPLDVLWDTIQPFPSFSQIHAEGIKALRGEIGVALQPA